MYWKPFIFVTEPDESSFLRRYKFQYIPPRVLPEQVGITLNHGNKVIMETGTRLYPGTNQKASCEYRHLRFYRSRQFISKNV